MLTDTEEGETLCALEIFHFDGEWSRKPLGSFISVALRLPSLSLGKGIGRYRTFGLQQLVLHSSSVSRGTLDHAVCFRSS